MYNFIPAFVQNYGYAAWEHALKAEGAAAANWYVPLTGENSVNAFIHCVMAKGQIRFRLITPYNIARILESIPEGQDKPDYLTFKALFYDFNYRLYNSPANWVIVFGKNGEALYEYPVSGEGLMHTKAWKCHWVGVGVGDLYDGNGNNVGGETGIIWEERCS